MTGPTPGPLTDTTKVEAYLRLADDGAAADTTGLAESVDAVNSWLATVLDPPAAGQGWPAHLEHGATMLAATYWRRRATPDGVAAFGDMTAFVQRNDPDAMRLLGIGPYAIPKVG